jgi:RNase adaptor protein for sRNA GlmZ degradation
VANYLITGVSGSGKSSVAEALEVRGYAAIDADISTYSHWVDRQTGQSYSSRPVEIEWVGRFDWLWKEKEMETVLRHGENHNQFICGTSVNQSLFYPFFNTIFLLSVVDETIVHRLQTRTNNHFGKREGDIERALDWKQGFESDIKRQGAIVIDASEPLQEVLNQILSNTNEDK